MTYTIRQMRKEDSKQAYDWALQLGWNPGLHDWEIIPAIDPPGCFAGILNEKMVASIVTAQYQRKYGFIGQYIVVPEHRGCGYGLAIWNHAISYLIKDIGVECIGLNGVLNQEEKYKRSGFHPSYKICRYKYVADRIFQAVCATIDENNFQDIANYDLKVFTVSRVPFLHDLIFKAEAKTCAFYTNDRLAGFAVARPCFTGYKIGPLFADNLEVARKLFESLVADLPGEIVFIDVPETNSQATKLANNFNMNPVSAIVRMYTSDQYQQDIRYVYGSTTSEVG